jgi:hypothetical protein
MKLTPLPTKFNNFETASITISPYKDTQRNSTRSSAGASLKSPTVKTIEPKPAETETKNNYILPILLIAGGAWYLMSANNKQQ